MNSRAIHLTAALAAFIVMLFAPNPSQAASTAKDCKPAPAGFAFRASETLYANGAVDFTTYKNLPDTAVKFTQGGSRPGCVIVFFSAAMYRGTSEDVFIRAVLDGVIGIPQDQQWDSSTDGFRGNSVSFIFPSVAPGPHMVRMQWRTGSGTGVGLKGRNTIVHYVP